MTDNNGRHESGVPQCPGEGCESREYEASGLFGNLVCAECGYMPRKNTRDEIKGALN